MFSATRLIVKERVERLDPARQDDRLMWRQPPVDLDAEVDVVADGLTILADRVDGVPHLGDVRFLVRDMPILVEERREVADRREAGLLRIDDPSNELLGRRAEDVVVDSGLVAHLAAEQLIDRHAEMLARDVPECDVDGAERAHDSGASKVA
jgi:hypothetical protein